VDVYCYRYVIYGNCYKLRWLSYLPFIRLDIPPASRRDTIMLFAKVDSCSLCLLFFLLLLFLSFHFFYRKTVINFPFVFLFPIYSIKLHHILLLFLLQHLSFTCTKINVFLFYFQSPIEIIFTFVFTYRTTAVV
jgi:hypothetical protein